MAKLSPIKAAGTVVLRGKGRATEVLIVHRPYRNDWSLPKGKVDPGEYSCAAAVRETLEECGLAVTLGTELTPVRYRVDKRPKVVRYWLAQPVNEAIKSGELDVEKSWQPNDEVSEMRWVRPSLAATLLSYPADVERVREAVAQRRTTSAFVLLRHATAEKRVAFAARHDGRPPADSLRPLSFEGEAQTPAIAAALSAFGIQAAHSSPSLRCFETVAPDFAAPHSVVKEPALSEESFKADPVAASQRISKLFENELPTVVCSHRPVLPTLLRTIGRVSKTSVPNTRLDPGQFVVFHRPVTKLGALKKQRAVTISYSDDALLDD